MEKESMTPLNWTTSSFGMEIQPNEMNCSPDQLSNCFFNPNWDHPMDQSDPFESALSSIVSSPAASNAAAITVGGGGESVVIRELIGRLGSICNSGEISPHAYPAGNSTNTSCYSTPLNSPPKLNLSMMDAQIRGNLPLNGHQLPSHPSLAPFAADPGFAERAARFSCFGNTGSTGLNESELSYRLMPGMEFRTMSKVSSNQSFKLAGSQMGQENNKSLPQEGNLATDRKFVRLSRPSTPENAELGDSREGSSVSEQIPSVEASTKGDGDGDGNARKRKSIPRGKAKETPTPSAKHVKATSENDEPNAKRNKHDEDAGNEKDVAKAKAKVEPKAAGDGNQKQHKDDPKPPEPPKDYIHVRARRGQATDSHSLAERVRREKISERMKFLQDLVPGCNKVTGKAVMLDEIINYVQSLQRQVEFLSMKLATVNPRMEFNMEAHLSKDIFQSRGALPHNLYPLDSVMRAFPSGFQPQQMPPLHSGGICMETENQFPVNSLNATLRRSSSLQMLPTDGFGEAAPQVSTLWEDDLQCVVQMGFGQNQQQSHHGSASADQMKVEL